MSVNYVDIGDLSQKSTVAGTEKLPVSDTEYITPSQITEDYLPLSGGTLTGAITLPNNTAIRLKDAGGTERGSMHLGTTNILQIGYSTATQGYNTIVNGNSVSLAYGTQRLTGLTLNSSGNVELANGLILANAQYVYARDTGGTARTILGLNGSNLLLLGYATSGQGYDTIIYGNNLRLKYSTSRTNGIEMTSGGLTYVKGVGGYDGTNAGTTGVKDLASVVRNITVSSSDPTSADGNNGDIWIKI